MNNYLPAIAEISCFAGIYLVALLVTLPWRRRSKREAANSLRFPAVARNLLGRISLPLTAIILTKPVFWLLRLSCRVDLLREHSVYVKAWFAFWLVLLALNFLEGAALQVYVLRRKTFPIPTLLRNIIRGIFVIAIVFLILRGVLKIDISPLLASTALLTAVIGFALQGVLGNLLSGMSLHLTHSVMPSQWVTIGDVEGRVIQTNWRETRMRTVGGHTIVIPNSVVASSVLHNQTIPTPVRRHKIKVGASYADAPGEVIDALVQAALSVPEVLRRPEPSAYVTGFEDFGVSYTLRFWSDRYHDRVPLEGNVSRMIWYRFKRGGIEIPFPMSDKLLNDFMAVVYRQRRMPPEKEEIGRMGADLGRSDLMTKLLVDENRQPLLSEEELQRIAPSLRRVLYTKGEALFRQGEAGDRCFVVLRGRLQGRMEYRDNLPPREFEIAPGSLVGEMSLTTGLSRTATVTALEEAELLEISPEAFRRILSLREKIPEILARLVAERSRENAAEMEKLKEIKTEDVAGAIHRDSIFRRFLRILNRPPEG